ncbi:hypothetical protein BDI4_190047 [Burkholderia diffusa]|nr:hypothetical protein BDI4_190047 [Burkholderia diffusa]
MDDMFLLCGDVRILPVTPCRRGDAISGKVSLSRISSVSCAPPRLRSRVTVNPIDDSRAFYDDSLTNPRFHRHARPRLKLVDRYIRTSY